MAAPESGVQSRMDGSTGIRSAEHIQQAEQDASSSADMFEEVKEKHKLQPH